MTLWVTTSVNAGQTQHDRAQQIVDRCGAQRMALTGTRAVAALAPEDTLYMVGRSRDELRNATDTLFVNQGLLKSRLHSGANHPLIRALNDGKPVTRVIDGTLGLGGDGLHIAGALSCEVIGIEASPAMFCLLEEGLARMATDRPPVSECAAAIQLIRGDCAKIMATFPNDHADAVLLAPMYDSPDKAAPGFQLLRSVAVYDPLSREQLLEGLRVAPRVVIKWPGGEPPPPAMGAFANTACIEGQRVNYWQVFR
ncbi:MAG: class I SAM-dependent methyltransferase [Rhodobacterales bacterium]|nr:class I SAM-dependent methyltransferase [Rhodobacterales bacterium]